MPNLPKDFIALCHSVTAKRPKTVIDHILEHGFITTEELKETYGYNHPPEPSGMYANMASLSKLSGLRVLMGEKSPLIVSVM